MKRRDFLSSIAFASAGAVSAGIAGFPLNARAAGAPLKLALMAPMSGPAALFGQASVNCATMAIDEINARGGIHGRSIQLLTGDAGAAPAESAQTALRLWKRDKADVFVGTHDSAVRTALENVFRGLVPYVYAPIYEGGDCAKGTLFVGETPSQQVKQVIPWLGQQHKLKRWYLIGNDYIWPRRSNDAAKQAIAAAGATVAGEEYVPFTVDNFDSTIARIRDSGADAVFVTLVGGSSVTFNRSFASFGLAKKVLRFGTIIEENTLAGIGAANSENVYSASGFFSSLRTPAALSFMEQYRKRFGATSILSSVGESAYEGIKLFEAVAARARSIGSADMAAASEGATYNGPRGTITMRSRNVTTDIYIAKANGIQYEIVKVLPQVPSGETCSVS